MKIIVVGSTGFVATEVIRPLYSHPSPSDGGQQQCRRMQGQAPIQASLNPSSAHCCNSVRDKDYAMGRRAEDMPRLHHQGIETIAQLPHGSASKPLRFIYTSGAKAQRDQSQKPWILGDYTLMRGETESRILDFAKNPSGVVEVCVAKPGIIDAPGRTGLVMSVLGSVGRAIIGLPILDVSEIAATLLQQAVNGIEKYTLLNDDLCWLTTGCVRAKVPWLHIANWRQMMVNIVETKFAGKDLACFEVVGANDNEEDAEEIDDDIRAMTRQRNHSTRVMNRSYVNQLNLNFGNVWDGLIRRNERASSLWRELWDLDTVLGDAVAAVRKRNREAAEAAESDRPRMLKRIAVGVYQPRKRWSAAAQLKGARGAVP
ncbi:hypothetical protein GMDG_03839 [Pseudogymnoascus destructans 20631-21]|uniref:Thioester reductase (TE) domain-containing protein n=1 Tax=Pseudogymnoascus destructans (strain ATCC MYA-4855 / 20631-21) TaxID=658429 RepID=L8G8S8_PSED2|nr:hypothetical protein GMDG_03839 [Pseudogymnoascus destructans 20631-21]